MSALAWILLLPQLCYIAVMDLRTWKITNRSNILLVVTFFVQAAVARELPIVALHLFIAACAFVLLIGPFLFNWLGGGDFKFLVAAHLWLGPFRILAFSMAIFGGLLLYFVLMKLGVVPVEKEGRGHRIPFGPVGASALAIALLVG